MVPSVDPPAPVLVEGELEYIVEKILDSRVSRRKLQYLVKWKGYGQEDNSWVFASDVHAADLVRAFHMAHPGRPGGSGEGSVTPPQGGGTVVNSVAELPPVVTSGTSADSVYELPLVDVSGTVASEFPSSVCYFGLCIELASGSVHQAQSSDVIAAQKSRAKGVRIIVLHILVKMEEFAKILLMITAVNASHHLLEKGAKFVSCANALGMEGGAISDAQIVSSSLYHGFLGLQRWGPNLARLNNKGLVNAWTASSYDKHPWIQI
ncbi:unnamed protein product [Ranitomeya imitator]|uniref:Chromo domain-containing protein n=1 Tax=Ranitomeya imitator TaxID=111125 RepID=A0ABN9KWG8_9NEOB|nr:unnamed protein product [Ranitomeya imitator]